MRSQLAPLRGPVGAARLRRARRASPCPGRLRRPPRGIVLDGSAREPAADGSLRQSTIPHASGGTARRQVGLLRRWQAVCESCLPRSRRHTIGPGPEQLARMGRGSGQKAMVIVGLDVGALRIGVAVGDELELLASPRAVIRRSSDASALAVISRFGLESATCSLVVWSTHVAAFYLR